MKVNQPNLIQSAALILLEADTTRVLWARRNPALKFMGGYHCFTGGKTNESDTIITVKNCPDRERASFIACAVRETFEEAGILLVRNGDTLTIGQRVSLHDDLIAKRSTFGEILTDWDLWIDGEDFLDAGRWVTPDFLPVRFNTRYFLARCPAKQQARDATSELTDVEFIEPAIAIDRWNRSDVLIAPPVYFSLKVMADRAQSALESYSAKLQAEAELNSDSPEFLQLNSRIICMPLRTLTLPPAHHTNCFIVGAEEFIVIDAATPYKSEQEKLFSLIDSLIEDGSVCREILVSHLHPDHFGGESALKLHLNEKFGLDIPVSAHETTAESLSGSVSFDKVYTDNFTLTLKDRSGAPFGLEVFDAPGHARGHLNFYDEEFGFLLSCDNVVGLGTVVIAPPEGNMSDYFETLEKLRGLPNLKFLCGSHGPAVSDAKAKIGEYIEHRTNRENQVLQLIRQGISQIDELVEKIYPGLDPKLLSLAGKSVEAHLEKLSLEGRI